MNIPMKIELANIPTPLEELKFEGKRFFIKRDDLTGVELSGNKVRKLEYLIYKAKREKSDLILTTGGEQSNHARATVVAATKAGIKTKLFLWGKDSAIADGNLFMDKFLGAQISYLNKRQFENVNDIMFEAKMKAEKKGKKIFVIPEGGSTVLGIWGYISFISELSQQIDLEKVKGICAASGSGGTAAGMLVGAALLGLKVKIYAVNVLYPKNVIKKKILSLAEGAVLEYKLKCKINENQLEILDGYSTEGYKNIAIEKIKLIKSFANSSGIILDPTYTGKAFNAYYQKFLTKNFGRKVIFVHTGGLFGTFSKRKKYLSV